MRNERIVGIDFGTSASLIKVKTYQNGEPMGDKAATQYVDFQDSVTVPTLIFEGNSGVLRYGRRAESSPEKGTLHRNFKLDLVSDNPEVKARAEKLTRLFFTYLHQEYDSQITAFPRCDEETTYVSFPAKWPGDTRAFMLRAAASAGFRNVRGMDEPSAALRAVSVRDAGMLRAAGLSGDRNITLLIIDMGAGTTDLALCRCNLATQETMILITWPTEKQLLLFGGREIDDLLCDYLKRFVAETYPQMDAARFRESAKNHIREWKEFNVAPDLAERKQIDYCGFLDTMLASQDIEPDLPPLHRVNFEWLAYDYLRQYPVMVNGCISKAIKTRKITSAGDVDAVILTGGHSRWYFAKEMLTGEMLNFGTVNLPKLHGHPARVIRLDAPQETVGDGLAYQGIREPDKVTPPSDERRALLLRLQQVLLLRRQDLLRRPLPPLGNTSGNIVNGGLIADGGDWLYFANQSDNLYLYKVRKNGKGKIRLCHDSVLYLNYRAGWIYYVTAENKRLHKIREDGTQRTRLCDDECWYVTLVDDQLYYQKRDSFMQSLYQMDTASGNRKRLNRSDCYWISSDGDALFFYRNLPGQGVLSCKTDGTGVKTLCGDHAEFLNVSGEWLYYVQPEERNRITKIGKDGLGHRWLVEDECAGLNVADGWVFYRNIKDQNRIYRVSIDGNDRAKLCYDPDVTNLCIVDKWLYFLRDNDSKMYRMRLDGTCKEQFS